mgnify:FL=1
MALFPCNVTFSYVSKVFSDVTDCMVAVVASNLFLQI